MAWKTSQSSAGQEQWGSCNANWVLRLGLAEKGTSEQRLEGFSRTDSGLQ